jgi:hypothetical protein
MAAAVVLDHGVPVGRLPIDAAQVWIGGGSLETCAVRPRRSACSRPSACPSPDDGPIALFRTGRQRAGENITTLLDQRS